jgi:hypothetical protein
MIERTLAHLTEKKIAPRIGWNGTTERFERPKRRKLHDGGRRMGRGR